MSGRGGPTDGVPDRGAGGRTGDADRRSGEREGRRTGSAEGQGARTGSAGGQGARNGSAPDPVRLEVFRQLLAAVAEEMGTVLRRSAYSPNIKERRDFSCAVFGPGGGMCAQAAHIPVHLGSMPLSVRACLERLELGPGDVAVLNDPFAGGTHLPDITMVGAVHAGGTLLGYTAARAHHSDVGGAEPGSMPLATELLQEGLVIPPVKLVRQGRTEEGVRALLLANVRTPEEREGDLRAQAAAVRRGGERLADLADRYGRGELHGRMAELREAAARHARALIAGLPDGTYRFEDALDDDGPEGEPARIVVAVRVEGDRMEVDFEGTDAQRPRGVNAVPAIVLSAVHYVLRCLMGPDAPSNDGCLAPVRVRTPRGSLLDPVPPAPVAAGNVETSQRVVDVLLGALAGACPDRIPAASQGTMNNLVVGGTEPEAGRAFTYYETLAGGVGGGPEGPGADALHTHMTNTLNTPVEALEYACPVRVRRYAVRRGSGGAGLHRGGDGVVREMVFGVPARVSLLTERRRLAPYGLRGGEPGAPGRNLLLRGEGETELPGKGSLDVEPGDVLRIETPGGGGWGAPAGGDAPAGV